MNFFIKVDSKYKIKLRFMVEDRLIQLKGRVQLNQADYSLEPNKYVLEEISELENLLSQLKENCSLIQNDDSSFSAFTW